MFIKNLFSFIFLLIGIDLCYAQCGCTQKGIKVNNFDIDDMILSQKDVLRINGFKATQAPQWPDKTVRYTFDPSYPDRNKNKIREHLKVYEGELGNCIKFFEDKSEVHATVVLGKGCSSSIGYDMQKELKITLPDVCVNKRNVKHEFTHLLGFMHEHTRPDRDQYLKILLENVTPAYCHNFFLCEGCKTTTTYDFESIMQYHSKSFTCNGKETILKLNGDKIRINMEISKLDVKKVRDYYNC